MKVSLHINVSFKHFYNLLVEYLIDLYTYDMYNISIYKLQDIFNKLIVISICYKYPTNKYYLLKI